MPYSALLYSESQYYSQLAMVTGIMVYAAIARRLAERARAAAERERLAFTRN